MAMNPASVSSEGPRAFWRRERLTVIVPYVLAAVGIVAAIAVLGDEFARHLTEIERWMTELGPLAFVVFVLCYVVLSSVFVPDLLFGIVAGVTFGFTRGFLAVLLGALCGAALQYALSRYLLTRRIERIVRSRPALSAILGAVRQEEFRLQLLIRLTPMNRALTSYLLGAIGVRFARFELACLALIPSLCLEVYVGVAGRHLAGMAGTSGHTAVLHDVVLGVGLVVAVLVMAVISRTARRAVDAAVATGTG